MEANYSNEDRSSGANVAETLRNRGWALFDLSRLTLTEGEAETIAQWETVFGSAFDLDETSKESAGMYRVEQGVSVGYRLDNEREFFESRLTSTSVPEPNFPCIKDYATTVICLYSIFSKIATQCIGDIAEILNLSAQAFLDLTDIDSAGILPQCQPSKGSLEFGVKELIPALSSSLLRICKYKSIDGDAEGSSSNCAPSEATAPSSAQKNVWFGAHTDSSFLTISLCSTTPGLDIVDQETNAWVCPEKHIVEHGHIAPTAVKDTTTSETVFDSFTKTHLPTSPYTANASSSKFAIVFVGEFLQVLTKNRFRAAVHRVRNFNEDNLLAETNSNYAHRTRISCPFIIRGRNSAVIDMHNLERYAHPGGEEALTEDKVPNLDGTNMRLMHKLLDLKRQKCFRDNGSAEGSSWVLSAYPVPPLPEDN